MITQEKVNDLAKSMHKDLLEEGSPTFLDASGTSMYPLIRDGDKLKVLAVAERELSVGDVLVVDQCKDEGGWFCVHRLVEIQHNGLEKIYLTKGDSTRSFDDPVAFSDIAGKVLEIIKLNQTMKLDSYFWRHLNRYIAISSHMYPRWLYRFSIRIISILVEFKIL